jgi:hypothetical protein
MPELDTLFDATLARDGATFGVADDGVDNTKLADMAAGTIKGLALGSPATGDPSDLDADEVSTILDSAADPFVRTSVAGVALTDGDKGDITVASSGAAWTIDNAAVTLAKMANLAETTVIGRASGAGTGVPTALSAAQVATILTAQALLPKTVRIPLFDAGNSGASKTIDWADSNEQLLTLTDNVTLTLNNPGDGGRYVLVLLQDAGGANTVTWPAAVKWPAASTPTITATGSRYDLVTLLYLSGAGIYLASINQNYSA